MYVTQKRRWMNTVSIILLKIHVRVLVRVEISQLFVTSHKFRKTAWHVLSVIGTAISSAPFQRCFHITARSAMKWHGNFLEIWSRYFVTMFPDVQKHFTTCFSSSKFMFTDNLSICLLWRAIPGITRSKAVVCGRFLLGLRVRIPPGTCVSVSCVFCYRVEMSAMCREVLPGAYVYVWSWNLDDEEAPAQ
jgi:hypothetical protein